MKIQQGDYYIESESSNILKYNFDFEIITRSYNGITVSLHSHPAAELIYIVKGKYNFSANNREYSVSKGDVILFRSHVLHTISCEKDQEVCYYVLKLPLRLIFNTLSGDESADNSLFFLSEGQGKPCVLKNSRDYEVLWNNIAELMSRQNTVDTLKARSLVSLLILNILQKENSTEKTSAAKSEIRIDIVKQIYDSILYIDKHFSEPITPTACAENLGMSYSMYARCFKSVTGKSFKQYLTDLRMQKAEKILVTNKASITDIAFMCGYSTTSHFIKEFRLRKGLSPLQFRKQ